MTYSGVFILSDMVTRDLNGEGQPLSQVFTQRPFDSSSAPNTGYFGGGNGPLSIVDKTNYTNDTTARVPTANFSTPRSWMGGIANITHAYFGGGDSGKSRTDKLTFSTDTTARAPGADITASRYGYGSVGTGENGYYMGGFSFTTPGVVTITDRLSYSTDTTTRIPSGNTSEGRWRGGGTGNPSSGYWSGGYQPGGSPTSRPTTDKITYSSETTAALPGANLNVGRYGIGAAGNADAGYFTGGWSSAAETRTEKTTYSTETTALVTPANITAARYYMAGMSSSSAGYFGGGIGGSPKSTMDKLTYSTDGTAAAPGANLSSGRLDLAAASARSNAVPSFTFPVQGFSTGYQPGPYVGYSVAGNETGGQRSMIDKLDLATDTSSTTTPFVRNGSGSNSMGALSAYDKGYLAGGAGPLVSTISKLMFSTDVSSNIPAQLSANRWAAAAAGNNTQGYFYGGGQPAIVSTVEKMTYSTETVAVVSGSPLTSVAYNKTAMGNDGKGYTFGGYVNAWPATTTIQKMDYSTDTNGDIPTKTLHDGYLSGASNRSDHGYIIGGLSPGATGFGYSDCQKFSLTSDTISAAPAANLHTRLWAMSAFSNGSTDAYSRGGQNPGTPAMFSTCEKINYDTDTTSAAPGGNLSSARYYVAGLSPRQYTLANPPVPTPTPQTATVTTPAGPNPSYDFGYTAGGPGYTGNYKINFSTDGYSRVPTNMPQSLYGSGAHSSSTHGYATGGRLSVTDYISTTHKVSYADDTWSSGGDAVAGTQYCSASNSTTAGYMFAGGKSTDPYVISTTQKYTYSSDSVASVPGAATAASQRGGAFGNVSVGYYSSMEPASPRTKYKITYSDDTSAANPFISDALQTTRPTAASSPSGGYLMAGNTGSTVTKTTFSTDTAERIPGADLPAGGQSFTGGMGSTTAGYVCGGFNPGAPNIQSIIQKVNFSDDTSSLLSGTMDKGEYWKIHLSSKTCHVAGQSSSPVNC